MDPSKPASAKPLTWPPRQFPTRSRPPRKDGSRHAGRVLLPFRKGQRLPTWLLAVQINRRSLLFHSGAIISWVVKR